MADTSSAAANSASTAEATNLDFTDALPAGVEVGATPNPVNTCGGTLTAGQITALTSGLSANASGWTYNVANADVQFLAAGETVTFSYDVTVTDSSGGSDTDTVTITINGTNDAQVGSVSSTERV